MLKTLAIVLRAAQLYSQAAHHQLSGPSFFMDHAFAGETYDAMEAAYDSVVERAIGTGEKFDILAMNVTSAKMVSDCKLDTTDDIFEQLIENEASIRREIEVAKKDGASPGTINMLDQLADDSEVRTYKLKQRAK